jgi:uncharacterized protein
VDPAPPEPTYGPDGDRPPGVLGRVPWSVAEAFLLVLAVYVLALLWGVVRATLDEAGTVDPETLEQVSLPLVFLIMGLPPVVWVGLRYRDGLRRLFGKLSRPARTLAIGLALGAGVFVASRVGVAVLLLLAGGGELPELPELQPEYQEMARDPVLAGWFLFTVVLIAPAAEEILFRGVLYQSLRDRLGIWPGIGVSSLLFSVLHLTQPTLEGNLLVFVLIFPLAMFLAWIFQRQGSLVVPITVHATYNLIGVVLFRVAGG